MNSLLILCPRLPWWWPYNGPAIKKIRIFNFLASLWRTRKYNGNKLEMHLNYDYKTEQFLHLCMSRYLQTSFAFMFQIVLASVQFCSFVNNANKYQGFKLETFIIAIFIHFPSLFMHFCTFFVISANLKMHSLLICLLFKYWHLQKWR